MSPQGMFCIHKISFFMQIVLFWDFILLFRDHKQLCVELFKFQSHFGFIKYKMKLLGSPPLNNSPYGKFITRADPGATQALKICKPLAGLCLFLEIYLFTWPLSYYSCHVTFPNKWHIFVISIDPFKSSLELSEASWINSIESSSQSLSSNTSDQYALCIRATNYRRTNYYVNKATTPCFVVEGQF